MARALTLVPFTARFRRLTQLGFPSSYPLVQFPNAPLLIALVASLCAHLLSGGAERYASAIAIIGLAIWAWLELAQGVNLFRRLLGVAFLILLVIQLAGQLTS